MLEKHNAASHHTNAALHHEQAARCHREASRHFEVGKDSAHAAHQALIAHSHTLQAVEHSNEALRYYAKHNGNPTPVYPKTDPGITAKSETD